jgi:hypothetical protein
MVIIELGFRQQAKFLSSRSTRLSYLRSSDVNQRMKRGSKSGWNEVSLFVTLKGIVIAHDSHSMIAVSRHFCR